MQQAAREASDKREAKEDRRHIAIIEEARAARAQDAEFRQEANELKKTKVELEKRKLDATERQGAEINEVKGLRG